MQLHKLRTDELTSNCVEKVAMASNRVNVWAVEITLHHAFKVRVWFWVFRVRPNCFIHGATL